VSAYRQVKKIMPRRFDRTVFDLLDRNGLADPGNGITVSRDPRPAAMAGLVERAGSGAHIRHVRDARYFAWRFQNPRAVYRFLFCEGTPLQGYLVLCASLGSAPGVRIVDWEGTTADVRHRLLEAALQKGAFRDMLTWAAAITEEDRLFLGNLGFQEPQPGISQDPSMALVRCTGDDMLNEDWVEGGLRLLDLANWDLRMIYSDGS
jgi:hypothetical protein